MKKNTRLYLAGLIIILGALSLVLFIVFSSGKNKVPKSTAVSNEVLDEIYRKLHSAPGSARSIAFDLLNMDPEVITVVNKIELLRHIGTSFAMEENYLEALSYYSKALDLAEEIMDLYQIASLNNNIGIINKEIRNYNNAIAHHTRALELFLQLGQKEKVFRSYNNLGLLYMVLDMQERSLEYLHMALEGSSAMHDTIATCAALGNISSALLARGETDSAYQYINQAIELSKTSHNQYSLCLSLRYLGNLEMAEKNYRNAYEAYLWSRELAREINQPIQVALANVGLAGYYLALNDFENARLLADNIKESGIELNNKSLEMNAHQLFTDIFRRLGDYRQALFHQDMYYRLKEEINNSAVVHQVYSFEITNLNRANELQKLTLEKQALELSRKNTMILFMALISFVLIISAFVVFRYKKRESFQKTITSLTRKKSQEAVIAEIEERKRVGQELHDSLGQLLSVAGLNLSVLLMKNGLSEEKKTKLINTSLTCIENAFIEVRNISHNLAPILLSQQGLTGALKTLADQVNSCSKLKIHYETFGLNSSLNPVVENTLYRAIQETLNNTLKHADAPNLFYSVTQSKTDITLICEDNGNGFDLTELNHKQGSGLHHMKTRVENLSGTFYIDSQKGRGTIISIVLPLNQKS